MIGMSRIDTSAMAELLGAAGEPTRLRVLALLSRGELAVGEIAQVLAQSQPRVSRHLRVLAEAGLVTRQPEGAWVFFRAANHGAPARLIASVLAELDPADSVLARDAERLGAVHAARAEQAATYFEANAEEWTALRRLHQPEAAVEAAMVDASGQGRFDLHLDLGSGTGRVLELFLDRSARAEGVDASRKMLAVARANLDAGAGMRVGLRQADILALPYESGCADLVTIHQVLHYLADPAAAVAEASRLVAPGGRLLIADFAPHSFEELRANHQHRRLGFADDEVAAWYRDAGLETLSIAQVQPEGTQGPALAVTLWAALRPPEPSVRRAA